jgi:pyruvate dehydrogenase kinase 2/3/4
MPSVQAVKQIYIDSLMELVQIPRILDAHDEAYFARKLEGLYGKHSNVLIQMARGAYELRQQVRSGKVRGGVSAEDPSSIEFERMDDCHEALDRFYMSRIGIRVLAGQYLALRGEPLNNYIGLICSNTSPLEIVQYAASDATHMCEREYGYAPTVVIQGRLDLTFPYIPTHLHYILLELLKNAMRATMDKHGHEDDVPDVMVIIADGTENEDVVIKVSDEGGGIRRSQIQKIWSYLFTTVDPSKQDAFFSSSDHSPDSPLAGLGYGLPISRSYATYFGGDLDIMSMEGFGTDAFVFLRRLGDSQEPLPV